MNRRQHPHQGSYRQSPFNSIPTMEYIPQYMGLPLEELSHVGDAFHQNYAQFELGKDHLQTAMDSLLHQTSGSNREHAERIVADARERLYEIADSKDYSRMGLDIMSLTNQYQGRIMPLLQEKEKIENYRQAILSSDLTEEDKQLQLQNLSIIEEDSGLQYEPGTFKITGGGFQAGPMLNKVDLHGAVMNTLQGVLEDAEGISYEKALELALTQVELQPDIKSYLSTRAGISGNLKRKELENQGNLSPEEIDRMVEDYTDLQRNQPIANIVSQAVNKMRRNTGADTSRSAVGPKSANSEDGGSGRTVPIPHIIDGDEVPSKFNSYQELSEKMDEIEQSYNMFVEGLEQYDYDEATDTYVTYTKDPITGESIAVDHTSIIAPQLAELKRQKEELGTLKQYAAERAAAMFEKEFGDNVDPSTITRATEEHYNDIRDLLEKMPDDNELIKFEDGYEKLRQKHILNYFQSIELAGGKKFIPIPHGISQLYNGLVSYLGKHYGLENAEERKWNLPQLGDWTFDDARQTSVKMRNIFDKALKETTQMDLSTRYGQSIDPHSKEAKNLIHYLNSSRGALDYMDSNGVQDEAMRAHFNKRSGHQINPISMGYDEEMGGFFVFAQVTDADGGHVMYTNIKNNSWSSSNLDNWGQTSIRVVSAINKNLPKIPGVVHIDPKSFGLGEEVDQIIDGHKFRVINQNGFFNVQYSTPDGESVSENFQTRNQATGYIHRQFNQIIETHLNDPKRTPNAIVSPNQILQGMQRSKVGEAVRPRQTSVNNWDNFRNTLGERESSNDYTARRDNSQYLGKYQFGNKALQDLGFKDAQGRWTGKMNVRSDQDFLNNAKAQETAFAEWIPRLERSLKSKVSWKVGEEDNERTISVNPSDLIGQAFKDTIITWEGLLAASHLQGVVGAVRAIHNNSDIEDGLGTKISEYLSMFE